MPSFIVIGYVTDYKKGTVFPPFSGVATKKVHPK